MISLFILYIYISESQGIYTAHQLNLQYINSMAIVFIALFEQA